ncbi:hypothetical protein [Streptomyces cylindrosporus]|uniref:Lipoprotein n=1 Tax=Streptomyces cylindrosporus TaxID=2927583 RepID=A0ABS9YIW7_9ACTN|nr:hypothetical protein [Streptomyces cylindrosporus]MCI3276505.1 hypothetical protein [Streptomyces cylindrosporus]
MGSLRLTLCTGLLAATAAVLPAAHASAADGGGGGGGVSVTPSSPAAGADVALRVTGCSGKTATAVSAAFVADARLAGADGALAGETRVRSTADPGSYDVKISCADFEIKGRITVVAEGTQPSTPASPVAPVHAGGGGTAHLASVDARADSPGTAHAITGVILAAVAAAAVALLSGRRSRSRRAE